MNNPSFRKSERIVSRKLIETLFSGGYSRSASLFPIRAVYMYTKTQKCSEAPVQTLVSVSKRHFKRAVKRNRVKRQIREAYRLNKQLIYNAVLQSDKQLYIAFIWQADQLYETVEVKECVKKLLQRVAENV